MQVFLNVYDLPDQESTNESLRNVGVGFYHTGVEVIFERGSHYEYSFSNIGISRTAPQLEDFGRLREQIHMGNVEGPSSLQSLTETINGLASDQGFMPGAYHIVHRNCNHFSDTLCKTLLNQSIPVWVNRAANMAANFSTKKEEGTSNSSGKGKESFAMPGAVKAPTLNNKFSKTNPNKISSSSASSSASGKEGESAGGAGGGIFSWFFGSSTPSESGPASTPAPALKHPPPKKRDPTAKKELTEKQKAALAKMKQKK